MENESAFKNWINDSVVRKTGQVFRKAAPQFDQKRFNKISSQLDALELKGRVLLITQALRVELSGEFKKDSLVLKKILMQNELTGFQLWPISEYISQFGLDHFEESFDLMVLLTQQFTSEFAIRPFLLKDPQRVLKTLKSLLNHESAHVRRWVSEGSRPILPWGGKIPSLIADPTTLPLLAALKYDEELYVRKSIANHLNDITKNHPDLVVRTLKEWKSSSPAAQREKIDWITRHALRTLIKKGHPKALGLMGVSDRVAVEMSTIELTKKKLKVGDALEFEFSLRSLASGDQKLIVDYGIGFQKSNGSLSPKIFKLKSFELKGKDVVVLKKRHSLKKITTMTFYPGAHELFVQVNGKVLGKVTWTLTG